LPPAPPPPRRTRAGRHGTPPLPRPVQYASLSTETRRELSFVVGDRTGPIRPSAAHPLLQRRRRPAFAWKPLVRLEPDPGDGEGCPGTVAGLTGLRTRSGEEWGRGGTVGGRRTVSRLASQRAGSYPKLHLDEMRCGGHNLCLVPYPSTCTRTSHRPHRRALARNARDVIGGGAAKLRDSRTRRAM